MHKVQTFNYNSWAGQLLHIWITYTHAHEREREGGEGEGEEEGEGAESDRAISSAAADIIRLVEGRRFHRQRHRRFGEPRAVHRSGADSEVPYTAQ